MFMGCRNKAFQGAHSHHSRRVHYPSGSCTFVLHKRINRPCPSGDGLPAGSLRCVLTLVNLTPSEQVIQAAHAIPAVPIGLDDEPVSAMLIALTVLLGQ